MDECVFCQIAKGKLPSQKVYEDEEILAFRDIHPSAPVHILVIPKKHIAANLSDVRPEQAEILAKLQLVAAKVARKAGISEFSYRTNSGSSSGQDVWHLHYHLQGGWKGGED